MSGLSLSTLKMPTSRRIKGLVGARSISKEKGLSQPDLSIDDLKQSFLLQEALYTDQTPSQFFTDLHKDFVTAMAEHQVNDDVNSHAEASQFIQSVKITQKTVANTLIALATNPTDPITVSNLLNKVTPEVASLMTQALTAADLVANSSEGTEGAGGLIYSLIEDGAYNPETSIQVDLMNAVFAAIDIGTAISNAVTATSDLYTKISGMMNDLNALANYFNQIYSSLKAELQKHARDGQSAPPTINWDGSYDVQVTDSKGKKHNVTWTFQDLIENANKDLGTHYSATVNNRETYITSPDLPLPSNENLKQLITAQQGYISPSVMRSIVQVVSNSMQGLIQGDVSGEGQFASNWKDFAKNDGQTTGAIQAFSSTISTLSQKASQSTSTVNLVLNTVQTLFQKLLDLISSSGSAQDKVSNS